MHQIVLVTEHTSIFHRQWPVLDPQWHNQALSDVFDLAFSIRDSFFQIIAADNPVEFDLAIAAKVNTFSKLKVSRVFRGSMVTGCTLDRSLP